jgi:hypothetical protein
MHKELRRNHLLEIASLSLIPSAPAVVDPTDAFVWLEIAALITSSSRSTRSTVIFHLFTRYQDHYDVDVLPLANNTWTQTGEEFRRYT